MVVETEGIVVGTFQILYLFHLAGLGREDALVEAVAVHRDFRNKGIGSMMMKWVIDEARRRGCRRVQLTSNKLRKDAHRFYERLCFQRTHDGFRFLF